MSRHYILTGPIQTGKTTAIKNWAADHKDVGGFISPIDSHSNLRILTRLSTKETIPFEVTHSNKPTVTIGKFIFDAQAFSISSEWLLDDLKNEALRYIVLDEVGKLELRDKGYDLLVKEALRQCNRDIELIFIVRVSLLEEVIEKYGLHQAMIITNLHVGLI